MGICYLTIHIDQNEVRLIMLNAKQLADLLTSIRALLALLIVWLGINSGQNSLEVVALIMILAWTTDALDGPLARRTPHINQTWIGNHDLQIDLLVALCLWLYLMIAGYVAAFLAIAYVAACGAILWYTNSTHVAWGVQALPYGTLIWTALQSAQPYGFALIIWVLGIMAATWPRFPRQTLPEFLRGMRELFQ